MNVENKLQAIEKIGEDLAGMAENDGDFQKTGPSHPENVRESHALQGIAGTP